MKPLIIILCLIIAVLLAAIFLGSTELFKQTEIQLKEIEGLKKQIQVERDSMTRVYELRGDSLIIAFATIRQATKEREEAHERTQKTIANLNKIIYISYRSDSARSNALRKLYKSYQ